jgi:hypothetical protein
MFAKPKFELTVQLFAISHPQSRLMAQHFVFFCNLLLVVAEAPDVVVLERSFF